MRLEELDYDLPAGLIAQYPAEPRDQARLLVVKRDSGEMVHTTFCQLGCFLRAGDALVVNDTRVIPARLYGRRVSGGRVEVLLLRRQVGRGEVWECLINRGSRVKDGERIVFAPDCEGMVIGNGGRGIRFISFSSVVDLLDRIEQIGHIPIPPYIRKGKDLSTDREGYQTIFAKEAGAIAAPTAGLHFTHRLVRELEEMGVAVIPITLHVGIGSFRPIRSDEVEGHRLEGEVFRITPTAAGRINTARDKGGKICAVGTTVVRALETACEDGGRVYPQEGVTELFITPGYRFRAVDALITNFHLPRSPLLLLVFAFAGRGLVMRCYEEAIRRNYRFYSYGDGMLIM